MLINPTKDIVCQPDIELPANVAYDVDEIHAGILVAGAGFEPAAFRL